LACSTVERQKLYNTIAGIGWIIAGIDSGQIAARFGYSVTLAIASGLLVLSVFVLLSIPDSSEIPSPVAEPGASQFSAFGPSPCASSMPFYGTAFHFGSPLPTIPVSSTNFCPIGRYTGTSASEADEPFNLTSRLNANP